MLEKIHAAFHQPSSDLYRKLNPTIWFLILASIILFFILLSLGPSHPATPYLEFIDQFLLIAFALEYILRVLTYNPPVFELLKYGLLARIRAHLLGRFFFALHPLNLIDLLTVLGGYPALRGLRALRLLRLVRLLTLNQVFKYSNPFHGLIDAVEKNALLYSLAFSIIGTATVVGGVSIFLLEQEINPGINKLTDGLWWALVTLTTVGYGDISPITGIGRIVSGVLMISGMFTLALFAGVVGHTMLHSILSVREEQFRMSSTMNHLIICGYDPGARMLLDAVVEEFDPEKTHMVIFSKGTRPNDIPLTFEWISGDPTKESELGKVRFSYASACIVVGQRDLLPQAADAQTILTIFTIRSFLKKQSITQRRKAPLYITAEILDSENVNHAKTAGADEVIETTKVGFSLLSHAVQHRGSADVIGLIARPGFFNLYIGSLPQNLMIPAPYMEIEWEMKKRYNSILIGILKEDGEKLLKPEDTFTVTTEHQLIYLSTHQTLPQTEESLV
ncbi:MAG: hypothetical protein CMK59_06725 [Proteobacteria bacterium]|nr:hypothetical protein [Pseudomonadota bacterium]